MIILLGHCTGRYSHIKILFVLEELKNKYNLQLASLPYIINNAKT